MADEKEEQATSASEPEPAAPDAPAPKAEGASPGPAAAGDEAPLVGPEVERLAVPGFAAKRIPDLGPRPSTMFLVVVSVTSLVADVASKLWAEKRLDAYPGVINVIDNHLAFVLAKNRGGAWGLLQGTSEGVRRPFFLLVSVAAIAFIMTLYRKLTPKQHALKWGLPLVLGGALGNVFDRIRYGHVIDFIDFRADWIRKLNELIAKYYPQHVVTDHWPTFNVADIAICIGVVLMAVDMFTAKRGKRPIAVDDAAAAVEAEIAPASNAETPATEPAAPEPGTELGQPSDDKLDEPAPRAER
ncbi:MAG: signal peptidase II [Myxococcales bacterium]|nr:signal peptidase II [Myxococcales bacterium]